MADHGSKRVLAIFQVAVLSFSAGAHSLSSEGGELNVRRQEPAKAEPAETSREWAQRLTVRGVRNFAEVTPTLYRGGQADEEGFRNLAKMGVAIVVDLRVTRRAHEREQVTRLGMRFVSLPWECFHPTDSDIARFLTLLRENPGKKVFVHCFTGDDRTGLEIAAFRMAEQGWTSKEARREMEAFGFDFLHRRICPRMGAYETHFPERYATSPVFDELRAEAGAVDRAQVR